MQPATPAPIEPIRVSQPFFGRTLHEKEVEREVVAALKEWREVTWLKDWKSTDTDLSFLMSDKVLQAIAKLAEEFRATEDLREITPPFGLVKRYGNAVMEVISKARDRVHQKYQLLQLETDA